MPLRYITTLNLINTITNRCFGVKHKSPALGNCKKGNDRKKSSILLVIRTQGCKNAENAVL